VFPPVCRSASAPCAPFRSGREAHEVATLPRVLTVGRTQDEGPVDHQPPFLFVLVAVEVPKKCDLLAFVKPSDGVEPSTSLPDWRSGLLITVMLMTYSQR
jgi:hypothetical protein